MTATAMTASTVSLTQPEPRVMDVASVAPAPKTDDSIFLAVDRASPSGRWAVSALGKCTGQTGCRVLAYETQERTARNSTISPSEREKPIFVFVRDAASGIEIALWDCDKVERPAASQCLPSVGRELARLLRDRKS
jgi:hypothetical protein